MHITTAVVPGKLTVEYGGEEIGELLKVSRSEDMGFCRPGSL